MLASLLLPWMLGAGGSPEDEGEREFRCEEAIAHAETCCPEVHAKRFYCSERASDGCVDTCDSRPVLSLSEAECVRDLACDRMRELGVCAALVALEGATSCERTSALGGGTCQ